MLFIKILTLFEPISEKGCHGLDKEICKKCSCAFYKEQIKDAEVIAKGIKSISNDLLNRKYVEKSIKKNSRRSIRNFEKQWKEAKNFPCPVLNKRLQHHHPPPKDCPFFLEHLLKSTL